MFSGGGKIGAFNLLRYPFVASGGLPEIADYRNRIIANGGTISDTSLTAIATYITTLKSNNLWDKFLEIAPYAGNNLNAASVKLKYLTGVQSTLTNVGFVSGDYSETTGLAGDNSGTKYLQTGFIPSAQLTSSLNAHMSVYARNSSGVTGVSGTSTITYIGSRSGSSNFLIYRSSANLATIIGSNTDSIISVSGSIRPGLLLSSHVSANDGYFFYNGSAIGTDTSFSIDSLSTVENAVFGRNDGGAFGQICNLICAFHSFGYGLTPAEAAIAYNAVQALQTTLGRQV